MLRIEGLAVGFDGEPVLEGVDAQVEAGSFVSLVGPSGSGKTSILRAVTGLIDPLAGSITCDVPKSEIGFLFQDDALLPWRTARENVALGLRIRGDSEADAGRGADEWLDLVGLGSFGDRYPRRLSGGQRKRVALAQVLALRPALLLMDEPFSSLDAIVRTRLTQELLGWVERERLSVLLVTHDLEEAIALSDVVYVLGQGPRARIRGRHEIDLPRPRDVMAVKSSPAFGALLPRLWAELDAAVRDAERTRIGST